MRKRVLETLCCAGFMGVSCWVSLVQAADANSRYVDGIVAVVNDEVITVSQVLRQTMPRERVMVRHMSMDDYRAKVNQLREETLEFLINNELMAAEFEDRGYTLPAEFISEQLDSVVARETSGDWELFRSQLQDEGISLQEFEDKLERRLSADALFDEEVRRKVSVNEKEIKTYYRSHHDEFSRPQSVNLQLLKISSTDRDEQALRHRLQEVVDALKEGASFEQVAQQFSDDPTAENGGDLGWKAVDELNERFKQVAYSMEIDKISPPILLKDGIYLLKINERKDKELQPFSVVRDEIERKLREDKQQERYNEFIKNLRNKFYVKKFI
jgi:peptidyl-prolyl cis-trans isomerase SurA